MNVSDINIDTIYFRRDEGRKIIVFEILKSVSRWEVSRDVYWFESQTLYISSERTSVTDFTEIVGLKPHMHADKKTIMRLLLQSTEVIDRRK